MQESRGFLFLRPEIGNSMIIYLASGSPRRRELLSQIGLEIKIRVSDVDETTDIVNPAKVVETLSRRKAEDVFDLLIKQEKDDFLVIGSDTVVAINGKILGKPVDEEDAYNMLSSLSGHTHEVYTGVSVFVRKDGQLYDITFHEMTVVSMFEMSDKQIKEYIETKEPMDKAGAYGIQGRAAAYIKGIDGDYNNVVGLPLGRLYQELCKLECVE